jgi:hypothetical protein
VLRAHARVAGVNYLRLARNKTPEKINFFIVNIFQVLRTEKALLGHDSKM